MSWRHFRREYLRICRGHLTQPCAEFVPHAAILDRASCAITHGGMGTTLKALDRGVPVCVVPFARDQAEVARRVEVAHCGTRLAAKKLTPARLRAKVRKAITMADGARRVAAGFAATGGVGRGADLIEQRVLAQQPGGRFDRPGGSPRRTAAALGRGVLGAGRCPFGALGRGLGFERRHRFDHRLENPVRRSQIAVGQIGEGGAQLSTEGGEKGAGQRHTGFLVAKQRLTSVPRDPPHAGCGRRQSSDPPG